MDKKYFNFIKRLNPMQKSNFYFLLVIVLFFSCKEKHHSNTVETPLKPAEEYFKEKYGDLGEDYFASKHKIIKEEIINRKYQKDGSPRFDGNYINQGPSNIGCRINCIAIHPTSKQKIFVGLSQGGIFTADSWGSDFKAIFDEQENLTISDIEFNPKNPSTMYAATGDLNGGFYLGLGNGMYKSTDDGNTWKQIGLAETRILSKIIIDPNSPNILYVSALGNLYTKNEHRGIYKSLDGGDTWEKIFYISDSVGVIDMVMNPSNPSKIFAVTWNRVGTNVGSVIQGTDSHIYVTEDAGLKWSKVQGGLPIDSSNGRIALAMHKANPNIMYALYNRNINCGNGLGQNAAQLFYTEDQGLSWKDIPFKASNSGFPCELLGSFGWYFGKLFIHPNDPKDIMVLGVDLFRSKDGGYSWNQEDDNGIHADKHDLVFTDDGSYFLATDGGLYLNNKDQRDWQDFENISGTQLYRVAYNPNYPDYYYGGAQDNGSFYGNKANTKEWERLYGGDGFQMAFHPTDPLIMYAESQNGALGQSRDGGFTFNRFTRGFQGSKNWDMPYMLSWHDPRKLIAGSNRVYVNINDSSANFRAISPNLILGNIYAARSNPTISSLHESRLDSNIIIAGTSNGNVWVTYDAGIQWDSINPGLPAGYISCVKTSNVDRNSLYVTVSAQRSFDNQAKVFKSNDRGKTWRSIAGNLPQIPIFDLYVLPGYGDSILFIGNDIGVYATIDGGTSWERLGNNLPYIPVYDIEYSEANHELIVGTFARSIQTFNLNKLTNDVVANKKHVISSVKIYPNPTSDIINVENTEHKINQFKIFNVNGEIQKQGIIVGSKFQICVENLISGNYIIVFDNGIRKQFQVMK